jgi:hypothetical protein
MNKRFLVRLLLALIVLTVGVLAAATINAGGLVSELSAQAGNETPSATVPTTFVYFYRLVWIAKDAPQGCLAYPPLDWDSRLGPGGLPYLDQVRIISATVTSGQKYWRITKVKFENINESGNDHSIYVKVTDENCWRVNGEKLVLSSVGGLWEYPEERPGDDWCNCNFFYPMYGDGYAVHIEDQYPSDKIAGMIMPMRRHVNYRITFQLTTKP